VPGLVDLVLGVVAADRTLVVLRAITVAWRRGRAVVAVFAVIGLARAGRIWLAIAALGGRWLIDVAAIVATCLRRRPIDVGAVVATCLCRRPIGVAAALVGAGPISS
jgi:hypothetical protein